MLIVMNKDCCNIKLVSVKMMFLFSCDVSLRVLFEKGLDSGHKVFVRGQIRKVIIKILVLILRIFLLGEARSIIKIKPFSLAR